MEAYHQMFVQLNKSLFKKGEKKFHHQAQFQTFVGVTQTKLKDGELIKEEQDIYLVKDQPKNSSKTIN